MFNSLRLQNFKNFRDATLSLGPLTVIVGTNASGKSNLRDAFRFIHGMARGYVLSDIVGQTSQVWKGIRGGTKEIAFFGQSLFSMETQMSRKVLDKETKYRHRINVKVSNGIHALQVDEESLYCDDVMVYESTSVGDASSHGEPGCLIVRAGQSGEQRFRSDQPILSQSISDENLPQEIRTHARGAMGQMRRMRFLDLSPEEMKKPSVPGQPLGDSGENLSSALQAICEDAAKKKAMTEWIRQLTPLDVEEFEFLPDQVGRILVALVEKNGQRTTAYSASDGTLRFLAMLAALMGPEASHFYFLEEIDTGIHPTRLNLLLELLEQHANQGKVQIVTTTHSPQLLAMLSPEAREHACLVYRFEDEAESHIRRIVDIPTGREVLSRQNLSRLHESGWLENTVAFARQEGPAK